GAGGLATAGGAGFSNWFALILVRRTAPSRAATTSGVGVVACAAVVIDPVTAEGFSSFAADAAGSEATPGQLSSTVRRWPEANTKSDTSSALASACSLSG